MIILEANKDEAKLVQGIEIFGFSTLIDVIQYLEGKQSGMAKGIDACASAVCINEGGYTIAIVGNGLDICYPSEHQLLMEKIRKKGALLSEYPPGTKPMKYNFPRRNRLISAWADEVIIIAPGKGSGSLITADYAKKYDRKIEILWEQ